MSKLGTSSLGFTFDDLDSGLTQRQVFSQQLQNEGEMKSTVSLTGWAYLAELNPLKNVAKSFKRVLKSGLL